MSKRDEIIRLLQARPNMRTSDIADTVGCSKRYARNIRERLLTPNEEFKPDVVSNDYDAQLAQMTGYGVKHLTQKEKRFLGTLVTQVEQALKRIPAVTPESHSGTKESAVLLLSDIHGGKKVYDDKGNCLYNKDIAAFRMALLTERVIRLLTVHQRADRFDEVVIAPIGDLVDGSGIYPNQEMHQDILSFTEQIALVVAAIWDLICKLSDAMPHVKIRVEAVPGNHGRQHKYALPCNNFDYMVYQQLGMLSNISGKDIPVNYSLSVPYLNVNVKGKMVHLRHIAPAQAETPAMRGRFLGWKSIHNFDVVCSGHLHHPGGGTVFDADFFMNGSPVGMDDLSERMAVMSRPSQTLFGIDPKLGVSFKYNVYLDVFGKGGDAERLMRRYPMLQK
jgi:hypothetical protein